jgi:hypothetical protein
MIAPSARVASRTPHDRVAERKLAEVHAELRALGFRPLPGWESKGQPGASARYEIWAAGDAERLVKVNMLHGRAVRVRVFEENELG